MMHPQDPGPRRRRGVREQDRASDSQNDEPRKQHFLLKYNEITRLRKIQHKEITHKILKGIKFYFAYKNMNGPQKKFISGIFEILNKKQNFIVESSTGTGKTLSLLTGALAWLDHALGMHDLIYKKKKQISHNIKQLGHAPNIHVIYSSKSHSQLSQIEKQLNKLPYRPKMVLFGSRKQLCINEVAKWNPASQNEKPDTINGRCNTAVNYYYEYQNSGSGYKYEYNGAKKSIQELIERGMYSVEDKIQNTYEKQYFTLLKTIYLIYFKDFDINFDYYNMDQDLRYSHRPQDQQQKLKRQKMKQAIVQIENIAKQIKKYDKKKFSWNKSKNSGARNVLSMQPEKNQKQKEPTNKAKDHGFQEDRPDLYYLNEFIQLFVALSSQANDQKNSISSNMKKIFQMESRCPYYFKKNSPLGSIFFNRINKQDGITLNIDKLKHEAKKNKPKICPYILPQRLGSQKGDLYLMPYTYLLNENLLPLCQSLVKDAILVFDEGHNVEQSACDGYSVTLCSKSLGGAQNEVKTHKDNQQSLKDFNVDEHEKQKILEENRVGKVPLDQQDQLNYLNDKQKEIGESIIKELKQEDIKRQKDQFFKSNPKLRSKSGDQNSSNPLIPKFSCDKSDRQLKQQIQELIYRIVSIVKKNLDFFFLVDKKPESSQWKISKTLSLGDDWQDHIFYSTAKPNTIRAFIKRIFFDGPHPLRLPFQWTFEQTLDQRNILQYIIKKYKQSIDLKFSIRQYNYNSIGMHHFFSKLYNVLYHKDYQKKYYLLMNQHKKIQKTSCKRIYKGQINLKCLTADFAFQKLRDLGRRSIIITSGTLKPIDKFSTSLGIDFARPLSAGFAEGIEDNVHVRKVAIDMNGDDLTIQYQTWKDHNFESNFERAFKLLIELIRRIPNGVLVVVSSYNLLAKMENFFKNHAQQIRNQFYQLKDFVWFEKKSTNFDTLMKDYNTAAKSEGGAVIFCVCRAKLTEGIDFKDQLCRGVIFLGLPYLDESSAELNEKQNYLRQVKKDEDWEKWKLIEVSKALNQSIGRVIRDSNDYGAVFLIDQRLCKTGWKAKSSKDWEFNIKQNLSDWIKKKWSAITNKDQFSAQFSALQQFFARKKLQKPRISRSDDGDDYQGDDDDGDDQINDRGNYHNHRINLNPTYNASISKSNQNAQTKNQVNDVKQNQQILMAILNREALLTENVYIQSVKSAEQLQKFILPLDQKLTKMGFKIHNIKGDGNCLFRSVSRILNENEQHFWAVKNQIVDFMSQSINNIPENIISIIRNCDRFDGANDQEKINNFISYMKREQYGSNQDLFIISYFYKCQFMIHTLNGQSLLCYSPSEVQLKIVHLGLYQFPNQKFDHYFAIEPIFVNNIKILKLQQEKRGFLKSNPEFYGNHFGQKSDDKLPQTQQNIKRKSSLKNQIKQSSNSNIKRPKSSQSISRRNSQTHIDEISTPRMRKTRSTLNYASLKQPITEELRTKYQNRAVFSGSAQFLDLNNTENGIDFENKFFECNWDDLELLRVQNSKINDAQWNIIVKNASNLRNLKVIQIGSNLIKNVQEGDLDHFKSIVEINFREMKDVSAKTKEYLEKVKSGKTGKRRIIVISLYEDKVYKK